MPDYHPSDRVLAIAEAMHDADNYFVSYDQARAAMNLALEEAAKVAEDCAPVSQDTLSTELAERCDMVAAAIRALKE